MKSQKAIDTYREFYPKTRKEWRQWLRVNGEKEQRVWLVYYNKESNQPTIGYEEAVEEALCFGWIDSTMRKRDEESRVQLFARRKPRGTWSRTNKARIEKLITQKKMTRRGLAVIEEAKKNGSWTTLDSVYRMEVPEELQQALSRNKKAQTFFDSLPGSVKRGIFHWVGSAKREETKKKRVDEVIAMAKEGKRPAQWANG
jgi:uncharacterized protein YdeI (YjbR/CyaY-like superfamily)